MWIYRQVKVLAGHSMAERVSKWYNYVDTWRRESECVSEYGGINKRNSGSSISNS